MLASAGYDSRRDVPAGLEVGVEGHGGVRVTMATAERGESPPLEHLLASFLTAVTSLKPQRSSQRARQNTGSFTL